MGIKLTKKIEYAISGLYYLMHIETSNYVQVRTIAAHLNISKRFLEQIFLTLREHQLLTSKRGSKGGYKLLRPATQINLALLYEILEGYNNPSQPQPEQTGANYFVWRTQRTIWQTLQEITLASLDDDLLRDFLARKSTDTAMYYI